jgi:hypothetical protein
MSEFDDVIREAREGLAPRATDQARVWKRLAARAGIGSTAVAATTLVAKTSAGATATATSGILSGQSLGALTKVMLGSMALTLAGTGVVVSVTSHDSEPRRHVPAASSVKPTRHRDAPRAPPSSALGAPVPSASAPPVVSDTVRRGAASPASTASAGAALSQELALLVEARQASEKADHDRARRLLGRLDAEHPSGALLEERSALRAVAACAAGDVGGPQRASDFLSRYSGSVYAAKVQRACRGDATTGTPITTKRFTDLDEGGD